MSSILAVRDSISNFKHIKKLNLILYVISEIKEWENLLIEAVGTLEKLEYLDLNLNLNLSLNLM